MTEIPQPLAIRLTVAFAQAVYLGTHAVEGLLAERSDADGWRSVVERGAVAVVVDPPAAILSGMSPLAVVDAVMAKRNTGTARRAGSIVIGLGPGFNAGADVDAVVETQRGHQMGLIIREGPARADSGVPGEIGGRGSERVLRAPVSGTVISLKEIGALVKEGEPVARIGDVTVAAPFDGCLRGMIHDGLLVQAGNKIGDVDPRGQTQFASTVSDKARAIGRAVLEAVLLIGAEKGLLGLRTKRS
jgi:xanthine dehydrogenase accessory factor